MERVLVRTTCIIRHAKHRVALCQTEPYGSRDPYFESWIDPPDNDGHWSAFHACVVKLLAAFEVAFASTDLGSFAAAPLLISVKLWRPPRHAMRPHPTARHFLNLGQTDGECGL